MQCYVHLCKHGTEGLAYVHNSTLGVANCVVDAKAECNAYSASEIETNGQS